MIFKDIREYYTAVAEHRCTSRAIVTADQKGTSVYNTFIGMRCNCGEEWSVSLNVVKAVQVPMRHYVRTTADRALVAERMTHESDQLLLEMRNSGGWAQPDPGVARMMAMAAAMGSEPIREQLNASMKGEKPN
jgi:hypothetical protein